MPLMPINVIGPNTTFEQLREEFAKLQKNLDYLLNGFLDAINVPSLIAAYISTADGTYPRIDLSSDGNLLAAYYDANNHLDINPNVTGQSAPGILFYSNGNPLGSIVYINGSGILISTQNAGAGPITISPVGDLNLTPTGKVKVDTWSRISNNSQTLQQALDAKQNAISGYTGSFSTGTKTVNVSNGIITSVV